MWTLYVMEISALRETENYKKAISYVDRARAARLGSMRQESSKVQSLAAGLLLSFALEKYMSGKAGQGIYQVSVAQVLAELGKKDILKISQYSIAKAELGKPYFTDCPDMHFNLSHSGDYVACAMANVEIGIDIQKWKEPVKENLVKRVLHEKEQGFFFDIWAAKEAYSKCTGQGLLKDMRELKCDFANEKIEDTLTGTSKQLYLPKVLDGYSVAVCVDR